MTGHIEGSAETDGRFEGTRALGEHLAASAEVHDCFAREAFRYAYGVAEDAATACLLEEVRGAFRAGDLSLEALFIALVRSEHLARRSGPEPEAEDPPPPADAGMEDPAPADAGVTDAAPPPPPQDLAVDDLVESRWDTGACHQVTVRNEGDAPVEWVVTLAVDGTISQSWNCEPGGDSGTVQFRGAMWNATLAPGAETAFGYCAGR